MKLQDLSAFRPVKTGRVAKAKARVLWAKPALGPLKEAGSGISGSTSRALWLFPSLM